jgi:hypothetical protein
LAASTATDATGVNFNKALDFIQNGSGADESIYRAKKLGINTLETFAKVGTEEDLVSNWDNTIG